MKYLSDELYEYDPDWWKAYLNEYPELADANRLTRELLAVRWKLPNYPVHFYEARKIVTEGVMVEHEWSIERALESFDVAMDVWWGPGSGAKTWDAAANAFTFWLVAPHETAVIVTSTTLGMLDKRVWGAIVALWTKFKERFPEYPAKLLSDKREIRYYGPDATGSMSNDLRNVIRGVAIKEGSEEDAMGNIIGVHRPRILLLVDEAQHTRRALIEARVNLRKGAHEDFRMLLLGNPTSFLDPLGQYSEPLDGGYKKGYKLISRPWSYVDPKTGETKSVDLKVPSRMRWETKYGRVKIYCGLDSPSLDDPKLNFMLARHDITNDIIEYGPAAKHTYTYSIGIIPPEDSESKLFSELLFRVSECSNQFFWANEPVPGASIDPSFSDGGDEYVFTPFYFGLNTDGVWTLQFRQSELIKLGLASGELPEHFAARTAFNKCRRYKIHPYHVVFDITGNQKSHAHALETLFGMGYGVMYHFDGRKVASDDYTSISEQIEGSESYGNLRSQAYHLLRSMIAHRHVKGMESQGEVELEEIKLSEKLNKRDARAYLESKRDYVVRVGKSPGRADTYAMSSAMLRLRFGFLPGNNDFSLQRLTANLSQENLDRGYQPIVTVRPKPFITH